MVVTGRVWGGRSTLVVDCVLVVSGCSYVSANRFLGWWWCVASSRGD
jgi:hypothetical protein